MRKEEGCTKGRMIREEGTSNDEAGKTVAGERSTDKKKCDERKKKEGAWKQAGGRKGEQTKKRLQE